MQHLADAIEAFQGAHAAVLHALAKALPLDPALECREDAARARLLDARRALEQLRKRAKPRPRTSN